MKQPNARKIVAHILATVLIASMLTRPVGAETEGVPDQAAALSAETDAPATESTETEAPATEPTETEPPAPPSETGPASEAPAATEPAATEPAQLPPDETDEPEDEPESTAQVVDPNYQTYDPDPIDYNVYPLTPFTTPAAGRYGLNSLGGQQTEDVTVSKTTVPVEGLVNTWDVTLQIEGTARPQTTDIVLILDRSYHISRVQGINMPQSKAAAIQFIQALIPEGGGGTTRIAVIGYSDGLEWELALTNNRETLINFVNAMLANPTGGTYTQKAIRQASAWLDNSEAANKHVILLVDGEPTYSMAFANDEFRDAGLVDQTGTVAYQYGERDITLFSGEYRQTGFGYDYSAYDTYWRAGNGYFNYAYDSGLHVSVSGLIPENPESPPIMVSHGNSTINEAGFAKARGYIHWTVHVGSGAAARSIFSAVASPGKAIVSSTDGLTSVFKQIAQSISADTVGLAARNMVVTDPMATGFQIPADQIAEITVSQGTVSYENGVLTWNAGDLIPPQGSQTQSAQLTYRIEVTDEILTLPVPVDGRYPTNGAAALAYTGSNGQGASKTFPVPLVNPIFLTVTKLLKNSAGGLMTDESRSFAINIRSEAEDSEGEPLYSRTFTLQPGQTIATTDLRLPGSYQVTESAGQDYHTTIKVGGETGDAFTVIAPAGKPRADTAQPDIAVKVTNKEKDLGELTVRKVFDNKSLQQTATGSIGLMEAEPLSFSFTVSGPGGYSTTFTLKAGEEKTLSQLRYGTYTVVENTTGFQTSYDPAGGQATLSQTSKKATVTVTNRVSADQTITAHKVWAGGPGTHPDIWFRLYRSVNGGTPEAAGTEDKHLPDGTLQASWENQPIYDENGYLYSYSVRELVNSAGPQQPVNLEAGVPANYSKREDGLTVTNTWRPSEPQNQIAVTVTKSWVGVPGGTHPEAVIELYDQSDPATVLKTAVLTPSYTRVTWEGLLFAKGNPAQAIDYRIREIAPSGYAVSDPVREAATAPGMTTHFTLTNTYSPAPAHVTIQGSKTLAGRPLRSAEFSFELYDADADGNASGNARQTVTNSGSRFSFDAISYPYGSEGTYYYLLKEQAGELPGVTYDPTDYLVRVDVSDDGSGRMGAEVSYWIRDVSSQQQAGAESGGIWERADAAVFNNRYTAQGTAELTVTKELIGRDLQAGEFAFELKQGDFLLQTVTHDAEGAVNFAISYTEADIGKAYTYTITEVAGSEAGMIYDPLVVTVTVTVGDAGNGELVISQLYSQQRTFRNRLVNAALSVEKTVEEDHFSRTGDLLHYSFIVTNTGNVPLLRLTFNDELLGIEDLLIDLTDKPLLPGAHYTYAAAAPYVVTGADVEAGSVRNTVTVSGADAFDSLLEGQASVRTPLERIGGVMPTPDPSGSGTGKPVPKTGADPGPWTSLGGLLIGGAIVGFLLKRRQERSMHHPETADE